MEPWVTVPPYVKKAWPTQVGIQIEELADNHFFIIIIGYNSTVWNERLPVGYLLLRYQAFWWLLRPIWRGREKPSLGRIPDETIKYHS